MISLIELILKEAKQVGDLYHFTSYQHAVEIVEDNFKFNAKYSPEFTDEEGYISFTRNKSFKSPTVTTNQVRFKIDGNKLSTRYKVEPYADYYNDYGRVKDGGDESEERINSAKYKGIIEFKDCLLSLDIVGYKVSSSHFLNYYELLVAVLNEQGIKYNIVNKF